MKSDLSRTHRSRGEVAVKLALAVIEGSGFHSGWKWAGRPRWSWSLSAMPHLAEIRAVNHQT